MLSAATHDSLQQVLVDSVDLLIAGSVDKEVFGGRLLALSQNDGRATTQHVRSNVPDDGYVTAKFSNAVSCIRRDLILEAIADRSQTSTALYILHIPFWPLG